ncbi:hypothetical protein C1Y12_00280 [Pseudomonas sp. FW305-47B]|nr:hypothetical protein C1Y12_00280 [Pseudomonas sp. FW305-47B]
MPGCALARRAEKRQSAGHCPSGRWQQPPRTAVKPLNRAATSCRSEPARDSGGSACSSAECAAVIASRLAPTI